jgi:hypothetical protein
MLDGLFGLGKECYVIGQELNPPGALVTTAVATGSGPVPMMKMDSFGAQLVVDPYLYNITHNAADTVTAISGTWHFVNGNFTAASVGATFTVAGASHSGNNGTFTILTYVSATNVTTATTGLVDETFGAGVTVSVNEASLVGTWKIEISNDVALNSNGGDLGQTPYAGHWTDMTSVFAGPAIVAVTTSAATRNQYAQGQFTIRAVRFTFTSTAGRGYPLVIFKSKYWGR